MHGFVSALFIALAVIVLAVAPFASAEAPTSGKVSSFVFEYSYSVYNTY